MYATPVVYPLAVAPTEHRFWLELNPIAGIIEAFRSLYLGAGTFSWGLLGYSAGFTTMTLLLGILIFNRVEKTFMDTV
jgi:lipopolysaccharide transport system permease protein